MVQSGYDGESTNGLLWASGPKRRRRVRSIIRVHRDGQVEAEVPRPARRTKKVRFGGVQTPGKRIAHGGFPNGMPKNLSTTPSEVPMKVPSSSWTEGSARFEAGTATAAPTTKGTKQSDDKNISRWGVFGGADLYLVGRP